MNDLNLVTNLLLRSEFLRALSIAEQAQLTHFRESPVPHRHELIARFTNAWDKRLPLDEKAGSPDNQQALVMREVLVESMDEYNDPFAGYIDPESLTRYYQRRGGHFVGIGIKFRARTDGYPLVIGPLVGGPLQHANLRPGDEIRNIDGTDQFAASSREISGSLRGKTGSSVLLQISRQGRHTDELILAKRQKVSLEYARVEVREDGTAYLRICRLGGKTHILVKRLLRGDIAQGITGIVLDLRDNPGGSTLAARNIVSLFSDAAHVYIEQFKSGKTRRLPRQGKVLSDLPLAIMVNGRSMSSSEIVAGALQLAGRATVIGTPTYGKGLIQRVYDLKPPLGGALRATIAAYATLDDVLIHGVGIVPDIYVQSDPDQLFRDMGSQNITPAARRYKRRLLEADILEKHTPEKATELIGRPDRQLEKALFVVKQ